MRVLKLNLPVCFISLVASVLPLITGLYFGTILVLCSHLCTLVLWLALGLWESWGELPLGHEMRQSSTVDAATDLYWFSFICPGQDRRSGEKPSAVRRLCSHIGRNWVSFLELLKTVQEVWKRRKRQSQNGFGFLLYCYRWKLHFLKVWQKLPVPLLLWDK